VDSSVLCGAKNVVDYELENGSGFYTGFRLEQNEVNFAKNIIKKQWIAIIKQYEPSLLKQFAGLGLERYHELSHSLNHELMWRKANRIFSKEAAKTVRSMSLIKNLEKVYGPVIIVDEENIGYEEIDWRLVRPNQLADVGPLHADDWFLKLGHGIVPPQNMKAIKVWVALCCEPGLNGLKVVPHSHKREWRYHGEFRHGFIKPQIDEDENELPVLLVNTAPGDAIIFHDKLLHGGAHNKGKYCRISIEFMLFVYK